MGVNEVLGCAKINFNYFSKIKFKDFYYLRKEFCFTFKTVPKI